MVSRVNVSASLVILRLVGIMSACFVILSGAKDLSPGIEMLRFAQHDRTGLCRKNRNMTGRDLQEEIDGRIYPNRPQSVS